MNEFKPTIIIIGSEGRIGKAFCSLLNKLNSFNIVCIDPLKKTKDYEVSHNVLHIKSKLDSLNNAKKIIEIILVENKFSNIAGIVNLSRGSFDKENQIIIDEKELIENIKSQIIGLDFFILEMYKNKILQDCSIVHMGSLNSRQVSHQPVAYHYLKGAIESASKSLAYKLAKFNVRSNVILAGLVFDPQSKLTKDQEKIQTKSIPLESGPPSTIDVANLIYFLISDKSRSITGTSLVIDSGMSLPDSYHIISKMV